MDRTARQYVGLAFDLLHGVLSANYARGRKELLHKRKVLLNIGLFTTFLARPLRVAGKERLADDCFNQLE